MPVDLHPSLKRLRALRERLEREGAEDRRGAIALTTASASLVEGVIEVQALTARLVEKTG